MKTFKLSNEVLIPQVGFGTYKLTEGEECYKSTKNALAIGYRHIDTAAVYENEVSVGRAIVDSGIDRKEIFLTTKVWNSDRGYENTMKAFEESLKRLNVDYVDLYLVHWPANAQQFSNSKELNASTWKAMEEIYKSGKAKAIGVSNFLVHHLNDLFESCTVKPMVNQIEFHPGYIQKETVAFCQQNAILVQAWSPLGRGRVLNHPVLEKIAQKHESSTSAVCLQFALQQGICVLPKSATKERIVANLATNIELTSEEIEQIRSMEEVGFSGLNPDTVTF
ncbi:MAG TPA: aldo/keto reductase [Taishania sp.]|nr:aldo/keto reductase [Taishania sp.]